MFFLDGFYYICKFKMGVWEETRSRTPTIKQNVPNYLYYPFIVCASKCCNKLLVHVLLKNPHSPDGTCGAILTLTATELLKRSS